MSDMYSQLVSYEFSSKLEQRPTKVDGLLMGSWYYGEPGTGKSTFVETLMGQSMTVFHMRKDFAQELFPYKGEHAILIDDLAAREHSLTRVTNRVQWLYDFQHDLRFQAALMLKPKVIVIISRWHPEATYGDRPDMMNLIRERFEIRKFEKKVVV